MQAPSKKLPLSRPCKEGISTAPPNRRQNAIKRASATVRLIKTKQHPRPTHPRPTRNRLLLLRRRPLQPDVPALIWQIGNLETTLHSSRPSAPARFERLVAHLESFYAPEHPVYVVYASPHPLLDANLLEATVASLVCLAW